MNRSSSCSSSSDQCVDEGMHPADQEELTDSMRMFRSGLAGGRPEPGRIGIAPEWFYKGTATILRAHGEPLLVSSTPRMAGGRPRSPGFT
jgi:hypothetical protein